MSKFLEPLYRITVSAKELRDQTPPRFEIDAKRIVYESLCSDGPQQSESIEITRWMSIDVRTVRADFASEVIRREGSFAYEASAPGVDAWHMNFAAEDLFAFYGGPLFAQDEMQCFEHPALGAVREHLIAAGLSTRVTDDGWPTPILIRNVDRRLCVDAVPNHDDPDWPHGLYGKLFARAPLHVVRRAVRPVDPPTRSNIIAAEAPAYGEGRYEQSEIAMALLSAVTAYGAAVRETRRLLPDAVCEIHTGHWGCGAYGGNPRLMGAVQILAARMTGLDRLVYSTWNRAGDLWLEDAIDVAAAIQEAGALSFDEVVDALDLAEFEWGMSDGN